MSNKNETDVNKDTRVFKTPNGKWKILFEGVVLDGEYLYEDEAKQKLKNKVLLQG